MFNEKKNLETKNLLMLTVRLSDLIKRKQAGEKSIINNTNQGQCDLRSNCV
jgi:hypothetical protein